MHPYYQAVIDAYAAAQRPHFHQVDPQTARAMLRAGLAAAPPPKAVPDLASVVDETIDGPHGTIPIRRYRPLGPVAGTCLYLHSGGWVIGDLDQADATCRRLAGAAGCEVVSVAYRLAPEHPFPQPLDDAYAALEWAASRAPGPLVLFGESAGGNLAAAAAIRARDEAGPSITGQVLAYPVTDHRFDTVSYAQVGGNNWLLSTKDMMWFWDQYCPPHVDRTDPLVSPLRVANAAGLPATLICVADLDPLRDEGLAFADRLAAAGVPVTVRHDADVLHGYLAGAGVVPASTEAMAQASAWIAAAIHTAAGSDGSRYGDANTS